jgi:hypothetical protein
MVLTLGFLDRMTEAKSVAQHMAELAPGFTVSRYLSLVPHKDPEFRRRTGKILRAAGVPR